MSAFTDNLETAGIDEKIAERIEIRLLEAGYEMQEE